MADVKLGNKIFSGVERVKLNTTDGGTVKFAPYEETFAEGFVAGNVFYYNTKSLAQTFEGAVFPEDYNAVLKLKNVPPSSKIYDGFYRTFALAQNIKSVKITTDDKETATTFAQTFRECPSLETVDLTECTRKLFSAEYMFYQSHNVKSILGALDLSECTTLQTLNFAFFINNLEDVEIVPNTIKADIRFNSTKLTQASIESIINGLVELPDATTQNITLNGVGANLTEAQKAAITAKNWTLVY